MIKIQNYELNQSYEQIVGKPDWTTSFKFTLKNFTFHDIIQGHEAVSPL